MLKFILITLSIMVSLVLFAVPPDLITGITKQNDNKSFSFNLKGGKTYRIYFTSATQQGKKQFNQKVYLQTLVLDGSSAELMDHQLILNPDSSINSAVIQAQNDKDVYQISVEGRTGFYMSQTSAEITTGYALDAESPKKYCDFSFMSPVDTSLRCTVRVIGIVE
jgi:hypothetical protein